MSQEPERDGTELDFDIVMHSQDEADLEGGNSMHDRPLSLLPPFSDIFLSPLPSSSDSPTSVGLEKCSDVLYANQGNKKNPADEVKILFETTVTSSRCSLLSKFASKEQQRNPHEEKRKHDSPVKDWPALECRAMQKKKLHNFGLLENDAASPAYKNIKLQDGQCIFNDKRYLPSNKQIQYEEKRKTIDCNAMVGKVYASKSIHNSKSAELHLSDDEELVLELSLDSNKSSSPKYVHGQQSISNGVNHHHPIWNANVSNIYFEGSPSEVRIESQRKKDGYLDILHEKRMAGDCSHIVEKTDQLTVLGKTYIPQIGVPYRCPGKSELCPVERKDDISGGTPVTSSIGYAVARETLDEYKLLECESADKLSLPWRSVKPPNYNNNWYGGASYRLLYSEEDLMYKSYNPGFIDSHCHLDFLFQRDFHVGTFAGYKFKKMESSEAFPLSFEGCVAVFCEPWTFKKVLWWSDLLSEQDVYGAFGCHPHHVSRFQITDEMYLRQAMEHPKVVALGEIGLDYSERNNESEVLQKEVFYRQLQIAVEFKKPIVIHCRDAHEDCIHILKKVVPYDYAIHRHCFTDTLEEAQEWLSTFKNLFIGFTGLITQFNKKARMVQDVVRNIPLEKILLETDAPYFRPNQRGMSNPGMAIHVAAQIAYLRNIDIQVVLQHARDNTRKMYGI